ncbi:hypothetical protein [Streptomyces sp. NPDC051310]|uniref:hypothetical protein n=1 Tax=Streptomyces sp. NPDC051310 TaxID=3365649 RepID=UPI0037A69C89
MPAFGHRQAPQLVGSNTQDLVLLLTAVSDTPAAGAGSTAAEWCAVHRRAGTLCARLQESGALDRADRAEAEAALDAAADGAERNPARTADRLPQDEHQVIRGYAAQLLRVGPVPIGYIHGDKQPRNGGWCEAGFALVDLERLADALSFLVSAALVRRIPTTSGSAALPSGQRRPSLARHHRGRAVRGRAAHDPHCDRSPCHAVVRHGDHEHLLGVFLLTTLDASPAALGMIMGVGGAGSLAGALLAPRIAARIGVGRTIITGFAVSPLAQVPLLLAAPGRRWLTALAVTLAVQLFWATAAGTSQRSLRQILCDTRFQGRMQAVSTAVTAGSRPLAAAAAGALTLLLDLRAVLAMGALLQVTPLIPLLASPVRTLRDMPAPPDSAAVPPAREGAS